MKFFFLIIIIFSKSLLAQKNFDKSNFIFEKKTDSLIYKYKNINSSKNGINAYRIQIHFASKKSEINKMKLKFIEQYDEIPIYLSYTSPYYKLRVGNFRTKYEAEKMKNKFVSSFPGSYIVKEFFSADLLE
tara:strand:- start:4060 stop:4452 length:393 start_codon:yes stop_codon:yes gene_type:complete